LSSSSGSNDSTSSGGVRGSTSSGSTSDSTSQDSTGSTPQEDIILEASVPEAVQNGNTQSSAIAMPSPSVTSYTANSDATMDISQETITDGTVTSAPEATATETSSSTQGSGGNNTAAYIGGGAALGAAAAAAFYFRKSPTAKAQINANFSDNSNMNPFYEGMQQFDNPLYAGNQLDSNLNDGFDFEGPVQA